MPFLGKKNVGGHFYNQSYAYGLSIISTRSHLPIKKNLSNSSNASDYRPVECTYLPNLFFFDVRHTAVLFCRTVHKVYISLYKTKLYLV
jgi:hypothetical protein